VNAGRTLATAGRVLTQIRHDPPTVALLLVVPSLLIGLVAWLFD
jgi:ABC-2 type transport system permease protein